MSSALAGLQLTLPAGLPASQGSGARPATILLSPPLGALSEWLADHPVMINSVLPLVLHALGNPELSVSSVSTLKKICRECKYDLPPYAANIVAVSQVRRALAGAVPPGTLGLVLMPAPSFIPRMC